MRDEPRPEQQQTEDDDQQGAEAERGSDEPGVRGGVARVFARVEDGLYIVMGVLLASSAIVLIGQTILAFGQGVMSGPGPGLIITVLEQLLLVLMIVELLYTVQVSFRERTIAPEPFLIVGLVAAVRRVLVLTAEFTGMPARSEDVFRLAMIELGVLTAMIVALVGSLLMLRRISASE